MSEPTVAATARWIRQTAREEGFHLCGITPAIETPGFANLVQWLDAGYDAGMTYLADRLDAYRHPRGVLPEVRSLVMLGFPYRTADPVNPQPGQGRVARYAWGTADYHDLIHKRLKRLNAGLLQRHPEQRARGVVDSAPLLEREFANLAGLGWNGKNTLTINRWEGSYFFLAAILTSLDLPADQPHQTDHCGTCTRCLEACPTEAFVGPGILDAARCISYLTIEHRDPIPEALREGLGDWLFGCDVCQDVCPWNRRGSSSSVEALQPAGSSPTLDLIELFELDDESFRRRFRKTPLWRPRRRGILRNAAIVLGNQRAAGAVEALTRGLEDVEPLVRGAAAWALGKIATATALAALRRAATREGDAQVLQEITGGLETAR